MTKLDNIIKQIKKLKDEENECLKEAKRYLKKKYGNGLKYQLEYTHVYYQTIPEWKKEMMKHND